jgi:hypothetical protein
MQEGEADPSIIGDYYAGIIDPENFRLDVRLGAGFYPEWHTLILGKARAVVADAIYNLPDYPRILMVSTDSVHVPSNRIGHTEVRFNHQFGPVFFKSIRSRVHLSMDHGRVVKLAKHAMPIPKAEAVQLILASKHKEVVFKQYQRMKTLREAILSEDQIMAPKDCRIHIDLRPDAKRRVDSRGFSHPLAA